MAAWSADPPHSHGVSNRGGGGEARGIRAMSRRVFLRRLLCIYAWFAEHEVGGEILENTSIYMYIET